MRLLIAAVGRLRAGPELDLFEGYRRRLSWPVVLKEVEERRRLPPAERKRREGELLLAALPTHLSGVIVALDERGKWLTSEAFAKQIGRWQQHNTGTAAFLIGGADGLSDAARARADLLMSLGPMTWPHLLVRSLLMEQLYRAQRILAGHPYHRA